MNWEHKTCPIFTAIQQEWQYKQILAFQIKNAIERLNLKEKNNG